MQISAQISTMPLVDLTSERVKKADFVATLQALPRSEGNHNGAGQQCQICQRQSIQAQFFVSFRLQPIAKICGRPSAPQPRIRSGVEFAIRALICLELS
jgi:hypothetical protein